MLKTYGTVYHDHHPVSITGRGWISSLAVETLTHSIICLAPRSSSLVSIKSETYTAFLWTAFLPWMPHHRSSHRDHFKGGIRTESEDSWSMCVCARAHSKKGKMCGVCVKRPQIFPFFFYPTLTSIFLTEQRTNRCQFIFGSYTVHRGLQGLPENGKGRNSRICECRAE